jgi:aquaporin Z
MKRQGGLYLSEFIGTALLVGLGLSVVILNFGAGSPTLKLIPASGLRRLLTGFLFGSIGALIAVSPVGKHSGAHINPVVTLAFWLRGKLRAAHASGYILAQLAGAVFGAIPLLAWRSMGKSVEYAATFPGPGYTPLAAALGEFGATVALIAGLFLFLGHKRLRPYTPLLFPFLYALLVYAEAPVSGTSTNPARSLGPEAISGAWRSWWVYWLGPVSGTLATVLLLRLPILRGLKVEVAKLYHFEHDFYGVFKAEAKGEARGRDNRGSGAAVRP